MSDYTGHSASRIVLYVLLFVTAAVWIGFGGAVFVGILQDAAAS